MYPSLDRIAFDEAGDVPILMQYGDGYNLRALNVEKAQLDNHMNLPVIKKYRMVYPDGTIDEMTAKSCNDDLQLPFYTVDGESKRQPILWKESATRHFSMFNKMDEFDRPWDQKKNAAVFRGALAGIRNDGLTVAQISSLPGNEVCLKIPRCRLVLQNLESELVDAKLFGDRLDFREALNDAVDLYEIDDGALFAKEKMSYAEMLEYKAQIVLEGDEVASDFKWALFSKSVVLAPPPTKTGWAMEELLKPWVHYVPLESDLSDVTEKMQWVLDNDEEAQAIAYRGSLWIRDLLYHPDVSAEEQTIYDEILQRYQKHFVLADTGSSNS